MKKQNICLVALTLVCCLGYATVCNASPYSVTFDTSSISGGTFSLVLDLFNGDGVSNNTITLNNFSFGGGSPSGGPTLLGDAAGNLSASVTLSDSSGFFTNEFIQDFTSGSVLSFNVEASSNFGGGSPDSFTFQLLDGSGNPVSTSDPLGTDVFIALDMDAPSSIQGFSSTNSDYPISAPQIIGSVPEPSDLLLLSIGLLILLNFNKKLVLRSQH